MRRAPALRFRTMTAPVKIIEPQMDIDFFRQAMRALASGVCIVASRNEAGAPRGIAMTAVMSLSFEPPSLLLAVNRQSSLLPTMQSNARFSVNILGDDDGDWCQNFVSAPADTRCAETDWADCDSGAPVLRRAIASIVCEVDAIENFGSHAIIRGLVLKTAVGDHRRALIYLDGRYAKATD